MGEISSYINNIWSLISEINETGETTRSNGFIVNSLNGGPYKFIREQLNGAEIKTKGIYFTNQHLAKRLIDSTDFYFNSTKTIFDPSCGAGDLLLECARRLTIHHTLSETLIEWGKLLYGIDIVDEFVNLTKLRLALLAISKGTHIDIPIHDITQFFPHIQSNDFFNPSYGFPDTDIVVANPPYSRALAKPDCSWARGKVTQAAIFIDQIIERSKESTMISAILPDVLRSGSRYEKWRYHVRQNTKIKALDIVGRFDNFADVDVFIMSLYKNTGVAQNIHNDPKKPKSILVKDLFEIHTGSIVPHRDPNNGNQVIYITARDLSNLTKPDFTFSYRGTTGKTYSPPLVAVKRTSSPDDVPRAKSTLINCDSPMIFENHILIFIPKNGSMELCTRLVEFFKKDETNYLINDRIRCRHLTIASLGDLPWPEESPVNI